MVLSQLSELGLSAYASAWQHASTPQRAMCLGLLLAAVVVLRYICVMMYNSFINAPPLVTGFLPFLVSSCVTSVTAVDRALMLLRASLQGAFFGFARRQPVNFIHDCVKTVSAA